MTQEDRSELLRDMRMQVEWTDKATMPIPLYERMKAAIDRNALESNGVGVAVAEAPTNSNILVSILMKHLRWRVGPEVQEWFLDINTLAALKSEFMTYEARTTPSTDTSVAQGIEHVVSTNTVAGSSPAGGAILPCDVQVGPILFKKGEELSVLVNTASRWFRILDDIMSLPSFYFSETTRGEIEALVAEYEEIRDGDLLASQLRDKVLPLLSRDMVV